MNIESVVEQKNLNFDRYLGTTLSLPFSSFEGIRIQPNDIATQAVINLSFNKLYENFLYLYRMSRVASNVIPVGQIGIAGVSAGDTNFKWSTYSQGLSTSQFEPLSTADIFLTYINTLLTIENTATNNAALFLASDQNLTVINFDKRIFNQTPDSPQTTGRLLSALEIYPDSGIQWKKIIDVATDLVNYSLFVLDMSGNRVVKYDAEGFYTDNNILEQRLIFVDTIGGFGGHDANNLFNAPRSIDVYNSYLYVLDSGNGCVKKYDTDFNWITTYRLMRDFLSAYPVHLSHDMKGNMYVLTDNNKIYRYDNNFQNRFDIPLDSLSAANETYIKLQFSPTDENIFYVLSNNNIYKKLITQPDEDIGKYLPYIYKVDTKETNYGMSSISFNNNDYNFVYSTNETNAGKVILWVDNINLFDVLSVKDFDIYTFEEIRIHDLEYLQN